MASTSVSSHERQHQQQQPSSPATLLRACPQFWPGGSGSGSSSSISPPLSSGSCPPSLTKKCIPDRKTSPPTVMNDSSSLSSSSSSTTGSSASSSYSAAAPPSSMNDQTTTAAAAVSSSTTMLEEEQQQHQQQYDQHRHGMVVPNSSDECFKERQRQCCNHLGQQHCHHPQQHQSEYYMGLALKQWSLYLGNVLLNFIHKESRNHTNAGVTEGGAGISSDEQQHVATNEKSGYLSEVLSAESKKNKNPVPCYPPPSPDRLEGEGGSCSSSSSSSSFSNLSACCSSSSACTNPAGKNSSFCPCCHYHNHIAPSHSSSRQNSPHQANTHSSKHLNQGSLHHGYYNYAANFSPFLPNPGTVDRQQERPVLMAAAAAAAAASYAAASASTPAAASAAAAVPADHLLKQVLSTPSSRRQRFVSFYYFSCIRNQILVDLKLVEIYLES